MHDVIQSAFVIQTCNIYDAEPHRLNARQLMIGWSCYCPAHWEIGRTTGRTLKTATGPRCSVFVHQPWPGRLLPLGDARPDEPTQVLRTLGSSAIDREERVVQAVLASSHVRSPEPRPQRNLQTAGCCDPNLQSHRSPLDLQGRSRRYRRILRNKGTCITGAFRPGRSGTQQNLTQPDREATIDVLIAGISACFMFNRPAWHYISNLHT
jgi:hypothetical protein